MIKIDNDLPDIKQVLEHYGAKIRGNTRQINLRCPFHSDTHQSGSANLEKNIFICFACGVQGNSLQIIAQQEGINIREAKSFAERTLGKGNGELRSKHFSGRALPKKQRHNSGGSEVGTIRRSRRA